LQYKLSKVVTLTPRFMIKNNLSETISVRQEGSDGFIHLGEGERGPLHRFIKRGGGNGEEPRVVIALQGLNEVWCVAPEEARNVLSLPANHSHNSPLRRSAPFNITEIGRVHVTLPRKKPATGQSKLQLVRVEVIIEGPSIFVHLSEETDPWPFKIQNETDEEFLFCQTVRLDSLIKSARRRG
jgi:vacuolar protein sorting-associated protein 13A/C